MRYNRSYKDSPSKSIEEVPPPSPFRLAEQRPIDGSELYHAPQRIEVSLSGSTDARENHGHMPKPNDRSDAYRAYGRSYGGRYRSWQPEVYEPSGKKVKKGAAKLYEMAASLEARAEAAFKSIYNPHANDAAKPGVGRAVSYLFGKMRQYLTGVDYSKKQRQNNQYSLRQHNPDADLEERLAA